MSKSLVSLRWPNGAVCAYCGHTKVYALNHPGVFRCGSPRCRRDFTATTNTPLAAHKLSSERLLAMCESFIRHGRACIVAAEIGVQYKTALVFTSKMREVAETATNPIQTGEDLLRAALRSPPSTKWTGYWQRSIETAGADL